MDPLTFYFDRNFGKRLPEAIFRTRPPFQTEWQHSSRLRLNQTMKDDDWLRICGERGWVVFSHDRKFHSIAVEADAIRQHKVAAFALCGANSETFDKLRYFMLAYPKIVETVRSLKPPYLFRIEKSGRLTQVPSRRMES